MYGPSVTQLRSLFGNKSRKVLLLSGTVLQSLSWWPCVGSTSQAGAPRGRSGSVKSSAAESCLSKGTDNIISGGGPNSLTHPHKNHVELYWRQRNSSGVEQIWGRCQPPKGWPPWPCGSEGLWFMWTLHCCRWLQAAKRCEQADGPERLSLALDMLFQIRRKI